MTDQIGLEKVVSECLKTSDAVLKEVQHFKSTLSSILPQTEDGISLFDIKNAELIAYLADLSYLMSKMSLGGSIEGDSAIERLIRRRIILEKMKPIENKLKTQVDRLISGKSSSAKELTMKARPDQFLLDDDEESDEDDDNKDKKSDTKKYVPPKIRPVMFAGDDEEKEQRKVETTKKRMLQSSLIRDLHAQYSEAPEVIVDERYEKESKTEAERRKYEEEYMVRLQISKKQSAAERKQRQKDDLSTLLSFGDYMGSREKDKETSKGKKRKFKGPKEDKETRAKKFKAAAKANFSKHKKKRPGQKSKQRKK